MSEPPESSPADLQDLPAVGGAAPDTRGKHRIIAELKRLEQETRFLEEELEELERTDKVSSACKEYVFQLYTWQELLQNVESQPDPLLPVTNGPVNYLWERWFEGPQDSQGCRCLIL